MEARSRGCGLQSALYRDAQSRYLADCVRDHGRDRDRFYHRIQATENRTVTASRQSRLYLCAAPDRDGRQQNSNQKKDRACRDQHDPQGGIAIRWEETAEKKTERHQ